MDFKKNKHKDNLNSGTQTKPNLHLIHTTPHWKRFYKKLNTIMFKINQNEFIIPGYENSIAIFQGDIPHDAVFPSYKLKKPRYTIVTDYE
mgnify:CR=1 FL=1